MDELTGADNQLTGVNHSDLAPDPLTSSSTHADHQTGDCPAVSRETIANQALDIKTWMPEIQVSRNRPLVLDASRKKEGLFTRLPIDAPLRQIRKAVGRITGKRSIEIFSVINLCQNDPKHFKWGQIDSPVNRQKIDGSAILISGWIVGEKLQPISIRCVVSNTLVAETAVDVARPDVVKANLLECAYNCGYNVLFNAEHLGGEVDLQLHAVFPDGAAVPIGTISFCMYGVRAVD